MSKKKTPIHAPGTRHPVSVLKKSGDRPIRRKKKGMKGKKDLR